MYHFISGYTAKVAGTERGVTEPTSTFSPCFGGPFLTLHPYEYARLLEKKMSESDHHELIQEISEALKYFEEIGFFNEERMLEISFDNFVKKGYSQKKIKYKFLCAKFNRDKDNLFLKKKFEDEKLKQTLLINYLNKSKIIEKQKKLNISDKQLFDKILSKLSQQGFEYEDSIKILNKII